MDGEPAGGVRETGSFGAPLSHYKVCSTFDFSLATGSIGRAVDLASRILGGAWHPMLVASPAMGRYQIFGNLFAVMGGKVYRLDRHPVMSRYPVTPMREFDLTRHLALQTRRPIGLVDFVSLADGRGTEVLAAERAMGNELPSLLDTIVEATLIEAGRLIWELRGAHLRGGLAGRGAGACRLLERRRSAATACSSAGHRSRRPDRRRSVRYRRITAQQIEFALCNGFTLVFVSM